MLWAIENPTRFLKERTAISDLVGRVNWLEVANWGFTKEALLKVDADIIVSDQTFDVELVFPNLFPDTPAYVRPRSATTLWSSHQFGPGGVLCLEWGPDNWSTQITGADLLESAHKLLFSERGADSASQPVPSRHSLTLGQEVRASSNRIVFTPALREHLRGIVSPAEHALMTRSIIHRETVVVFISEVFQATGESFKPSDMPAGLLHYGPLFPWERKGRLFKSETFVPGRRISKSEELLGAIHDAGFEDFRLPSLVHGGTDEVERLIVLVGEDGVPRAFLVKPTDEIAIAEYAVVDTGDPRDERRPGGYRSLSETKIGIVGLGSVGSKLAVSLARCGVRKFLLVDDDVMLAANICRNELDWTWVGENKVDAVKEALLLIAPGVEVQVRRIRIAGQESPQSASTALDALAGCDLLIDATANPSVFVQLAAVAKRKKRALVWGEVFAGGIGGLLVRSRPERDPEPLAMRAGVYEFLQKLPEAPFPFAIGYDVREDRAPLIAFDAEVSQFAGALTSFVLDTVVGGEESIFPYSAYLMGFKRQWIFDAPFDTQPILVEGATKGAMEGTANEAEDVGKAVAVLVALINK